MLYFVIALLTYFAFLLKTVLPFESSWGCCIPPVELVLLFVIITHCRGTTGILTAAVWGLISDGLAGGPLGIDVIGFVLAGYSLQLLVARGWMQSGPSGGLAAGLATLIATFCGEGLRSVVGQVDPQLAEVATVCFFASAATAGLGFVLCGVRSWVVDAPSDGNGSTAPDVHNRWHMLTE